VYNLHFEKRHSHSFPRRKGGGEGGGGAVIHYLILKKAREILSRIGRGGEKGKAIQLFGGRLHCWERYAEKKKKEKKTFSPLAAKKGRDKRFHRKGGKKGP